MRLFAITSIIAAAIFSAGFSSSARADVYSDGAAAALAQHDGIINDFSSLNMADRVQTAINNAVLTGAKALEEKGYTSEAKKIRDELNQHYAFALTQFSVESLGDHQPLSQWLGNVYKSLDDRLGDPVMSLLHLDDINVLNYGLPVAVQPAGDRRNGDHWNKAEYSLHFVPLITVVTYWSSLLACDLSTGAHPAVHRWCSVIALICRNGMHSTVAPKLSDYVYNRFAGQQGQFSVDLNQLDHEYQMQFDQVPRN
jgi:hypothetical protein